MAIPWICSTCRTRLPSVVQGVRGISQHAARRQGIGGVQETYGRDERVGGVGGYDGNRNGNEGVRGRYSGRYSSSHMRAEMLRPETVLHQLEEEQPAGERRDEKRLRPGRIMADGEKEHSSQHHPRTRDGGQIHPRQADLPTNLIRDTDAFIDAVTRHHLPHAWALLNDQISPALRKIPFPPRRNWIRKALVQPKLHEFRHECTQQWLNALQNDTLPTHTLPSPYHMVSLMEELGFGKPVFYRPALWDLAAGINDLRLTHPNVDLQPGVLEVMKLWKLCHHVAITRTSTAIPGGLNVPADWSFLPPLTIFATSPTRHDLAELLRTIVLVGKEGEGDAAKTDYTSPALVTLDVLRTTPCTMDEDRMGVCAELPGYLPWVKLMETLLKSATLSDVPPGIRRRIFEGSDELRERYWRLLRRVGVRSQIVEAEKRAAIYRRDVKTDDSAPSIPAVVESSVTGTESSTSQSTATKTPHIVTPIAEDLTPSPPEPQPQHQKHQQESRPEPHIQFTTRPTNPIVEQFALQQIVRLGRALDKSDIHQTERIRKNIAAFASSNYLTPTELPVEVYEHLMMVLFALKHPKSAAEVWKKFTQDGYVPTVKTYTVLMQGASHAHDVTTMEKFWNALRHQAKLQPDSHAWSTRIKGLFLAKNVGKGLAAMSEMGKEWYTAARNAEYSAAGITLPQKGSKTPPGPEPSLPSLLSKYPDSINGTPRPGLVVLNTAIATLASSYYDSEMPKVLHWGRTFQIEPDLITYNALLNICMRHSRGEEALSLLQRMREKGIQADSTTWTVLLTALFQSGFLDDLTHEAQGEKIMSFIRSLEDDEQEKPRSGKAPGGGGGGVDVKGFALIIDRLLKVHGNEKSAAEVLRYMVNDAHLRPTAQIYTILMTSYFFPTVQERQQGGKGPDWNAIETLWTQISIPDEKGFTPSLDPIFFDRMVEGYALHHEIVGMKPAMDFLAKISERGMKPGFAALEAVARMLAQRGEWDVLGKLVGEVRKRGRSQVVYQRQRSFWEFVVGTRVLGEERLEDVLGADLGRGKVRGKGHWMDG